MMNVRAKRVVIGVLLILAVAGGYMAFQWNGISARFTASQFRSASNDEARTELAAKLLASGDVGIAQLVETLRSGTPEQCHAVATVVTQYLNELPPDDPKYVAVCRPFLAACDSFSDTGKEAAFDLIPDLIRCPDPDAVERCRVLVKCGLGASSREVKARSVRWAAAPSFGMKAELVPLLDDPSAEVRRAAMLAVGPLSAGGLVIETEELFRWLNDPDAEVRVLCEAALSTRGLEPSQIEAGRKLTHPEASERLTLLLDLQRGTAFRDPGPWLERLSHDADPAVRAGAARVACESQLAFTPWLDRLTVDPDPTVRQIVGYHRNRAEGIRQAGFGGR
jgi:hypothetical protein